MGTIPRLAIDPLGVSVSLPFTLCEGIEGDAQETENHLTNVIAKPALILELPQKQSRFYYRSVGWHSTVLLTVVKDQDTWLASECQLNPSTELMSSLFAQGRQIY